MFSSSEFFRKPGDWMELCRTGVLHLGGRPNLLHSVISTVATMMNKHRDIPVTVTMLLDFTGSWGGRGDGPDGRKTTKRGRIDSLVLISLQGFKAFVLLVLIIKEVKEEEEKK
jgi:hypothetical protein